MVDPDQGCELWLVVVRIATRGPKTAAMEILRSTMDHSLKSEHICHHHILELIFKQLSASSAASFLATLQLLRLDLPTEGFRRRYVRPIRDVPEYRPWIKS